MLPPNSCTTHPDEHDLRATASAGRSSPLSRDAPLRRRDVRPPVIAEWDQINWYAAMMKSVVLITRKPLGSSVTSQSVPASFSMRPLTTRESPEPSVRRHH